MASSTTTTTTPLLSSPPSSINNLQHHWLQNSTQTLINHLQLNTHHPICIFHLPHTLTSQNPHSYTPYHTPLGPIHHFHTHLYTNQEQLKITTAKTLLKPYKITPQSLKIIHQKIIDLVPLVRCCYDLYFDVNDECLAWVFVVDALFLIDVLTKVADGDHLECLEDVFMVENQIPLVIIVELLNAIHQHSDGEFDDSFVSNLLVKLCEKRSPLKISAPETELDVVELCNAYHLLDCMYQLIVNHKLSPKNPFLRANFLLDVHLDDVEHSVQMAGELFPGASAFLQPVLLLLKLPWDNIITLIKKIFGENNNTTMIEIDIPSASKLSRIGKIEFCSTNGGIHDIEFDEEKPSITLPVLDLKPDSEVVLRNLVAYEELMFKKDNFTSFDFTEYVDFMCGIIDGVKDVKILREKNIIIGDMNDEDVAKLFNGITKSSLKTDGLKRSELQKTIEKVNTYYGGIPRVKVFNLMKKVFLASWKIMVILFSVLSLVLMIVTGVCQVYDCKGCFGLANVRLVFHLAIGDNQVVDV